MNASGRPCLVVSFHDLAPHSWEACRAFIADMREAGAPRLSLLAVPKWHDGTTIDEHPRFVTWLHECTAQGHEIVLHGYIHIVDRVFGGPIQQLMGNVYTRREGEFYQLGYAQAREKLDAGKDLFDRLGLPYRGFVPPAWLLSREARRAVIDSGFDYFTRWDGITFLRPDHDESAPAVTLSCHTTLRRTLSTVWIRGWSAWNRENRVQRLAVHPADLQYPSVRRMLAEMVKRLVETRDPITYSELADRFGASARGTATEAPSHTQS
ncbi:MAG: DUF2334 domain-containing protein [bacterium]|nr:DUF2334 domain-containing protein [bacterium]